MCEFITYYAGTDLHLRDFAFLESRWVSYFVEEAPKPRSNSRTTTATKRAVLHHAIKELLSIDYSHDEEIEMQPLILQQTDDAFQVEPDFSESDQSSPSSTDDTPVELALPCIESIPLELASLALDVAHSSDNEDTCQSPTASNQSEDPPDFVPITYGISYDNRVATYLRSVLRHSDVIYDERVGPYHRRYGIMNTQNRFNPVYVTNDHRLLQMGRRKFMCGTGPIKRDQIVFGCIFIYSANPIHLVLNEKHLRELYQQPRPPEVIKFLRSVVRYGAYVLEVLRAH